MEGARRKATVARVPGVIPSAEDDPGQVRRVEDRHAAILRAAARGGAAAALRIAGPGYWTTSRSPGFQLLSNHGSSGP